MTKGKKIYLIIALIIAAITVIVHCFASGVFIDIRINQTSDLGKGLSIILTGVIWMIAGGILTMASLITGGILFSVHKRAAVISVVTVVAVTIITFLCWLFISQGWV